MSLPMGVLMTQTRFERRRDMDDGVSKRLRDETSLRGLYVLYVYMFYQLTLLLTIQSYSYVS